MSLESVEKLRKHMSYYDFDPDEELGLGVMLDFVHDIEQEIAERYVELPKDADGEYIHIGDRMENNERVARIVLTDESWEPSAYLEKLPNVLHEYFCNEISHYHKPTVEDVLREILSLSGCKIHEDGSCEMGLTDEQIAEYAAKLRLAGDRE